MAALGLSCCGCSFILVEAGYSLVVVLRLIIVVTSLVVEYGLQYLWLVGSRAHRLSCSAAHGIFLDQGSNPRLLHWQSDSYPLCHGSAYGKILNVLHRTNRDFPGGTSGKRTCLPMQETRNVSLIPGSGRCLGEGNGNPLQYSCLENPMDRGAWWATVYRVIESWTRLRWFSMQALKDKEQASVEVHPC